MSKSQIRRKASEVREKIRFGIDAVVAKYGHDFAGLSWFEDAIEQTHDLEGEAIATVQEVERRGSP